MMKGATALIVSLALIGIVASGCEEPNTTDYDPMGAAATSAGSLAVAALEAVPATFSWAASTG